MDSEHVCPRCGWRSTSGPVPDLCPGCLLRAGADLDPLFEPGTSHGDLEPGAKIGEYEVIRVIGRGGMGVVYLCRQDRLQREVAVKRVHAGLAHYLETQQRFIQEAQIAAQLDHPHVVPIFEVGDLEGTPYLVMKHIAGGNLAERFAEFQLPKSTPARPVRRSEALTAQRRIASFVARLARAVGHAHRRGLIHRDLKPSNVLVDRDGHPLLTDFGIARWLDADQDLTLTRAVLGSPHYLAPEQAMGLGPDITTAADTYSLGVILYELLTGQTPFTGASAYAVMRQTVEDEPVVPRSINPLIDRDLEVVCLRCLEKAPERRYPTSDDLAEDLERFAAGDPVQARAAGPLERFGRWVRRHPTLASLLGVTVIGLGLVTWQWRRAEAASVELRENLCRSDLLQVESLYDKDQASGALEHLATTVRNNPGHPLARARLLSALSHRNYPLPLVELPPFADEPTHLRFSPDGARLMVGSADGKCSLWNRTNGHRLWEQQAHTGPIYVVRFHPGGERGFTTADDGQVRVFDVATGREQARISLSGPVLVAEYNPEGSQILGVSAGQAWLWDGSPQGSHRVLGSDTNITSAHFATGARVITFHTDQSIRIGQIDSTPFTSRLLLAPNATNAFVDFEVNPAGDQLALIQAGVISLWDLNTGTAVREYRHAQPATTVSFSPDGGRLVAAHFPRSVKIWDPAQAWPIVEMQTRGSKPSNRPPSVPTDWHC
jgi:serine/threonine protein kinase